MIDVDPSFWTWLDAARERLAHVTKLYDEMGALLKDTRLLTPDFNTLLSAQRLFGARMVEERRIVEGFEAKLTEAGVDERTRR